MKKRIKQGRSSKYILLMIIVVLVSLSLLTLSACSDKIDVASISVIDNTIPQDVRVSDFNIEDITITVLDSQGRESTVAASATMLTTESRDKLTQGGTHNITIRYQQKTTTFTVRLFDDDAELVTVTFKNKSNNIISKAITIKGGSVTPPAHPEIEGMIADGWINSSNEEVTFNSVNESIEVKARYAQDVQIHTVTFRDDKGAVIETMQVEHGNRLTNTPDNKVIVPEGTDTWDWYYGNSKLNMESFTVDQDLIIKVVVVPIKYTVEFKYGDISLAIEEVAHGGAATKASSAKEKLKDEGYSWVKWLTPLNNITMNLEIQAQATLFSYKVNFYDYKEALIDTKTVFHGDDIQPPNTPTERTGYVFTGKWEYIGEGEYEGSPIEVVENVQRDLEFKAVYTTKVIELTLIDVDESEETIKIDFGTIINADNLDQLKTEEGDIYKKEGHILLGFYKDSDLETRVELPYTVTLPDTLYTKWVDTINGNTELVYNTYEDYKELLSYSGNDAIIYIPSKIGDLPVTVISDNVFKDKNIQRVIFGENIEEIKAGAFENTNITGTFELPAGLTKIGARAFAGCTEIESISIPDSVTEIGEGAFEGATSLNNINISSGSQLTAIDASVFKGCVALENISIPDTVTSIGQSAFEGSGITSINLNKVTEIANNAFKDCLALDTVAFSDVKTIGGYAFANTAIEEIEVLKTSSIGSYAFADNAYLTSATIFVETLKEYTFNNCTSLSDVIFSTKYDEEEEINLGIKTIEDFAFMNCASLSDISIPSTLESISAKAFSGAFKLNEVTVDADNTDLSSKDGILYNKDKTVLIVYPAGKTAGELIVSEGVETIDISAFENAIIAKLVLPTSLIELAEKSLYSRFISTIEFKGDIPNIFDEGDELDIISDNVWKLYVPADYLTNYTDTIEFAEAEQTPESFVEGSLYDEDSGLVYIIEGDEITIVAANRLRTTITVPSSIDGKDVTKIAAYAFENCNNLQTVEIQAELSELGEYAFKGCTSLETITFAFIPGMVASINWNAFEDTLWYKDNDLIFIADTAVKYKYVYDENGEIEERTSLTIPSTVEVLSADLFNNEAGQMLQTIVLPQGLKRIGERAFFGSNIKSIDIPNSVTLIAKSAFEDCTKLETVTGIDSSKINVVTEKMFAGCSTLQEIKLPFNVTEIKAQAFMGCSLLREISGPYPNELTLPKALTRIGEEAFKGCISMPEIHLPSGLANIEARAFIDCNSLVYVRIWNPTPPAIGTSVFDLGTAYIYVNSSDEDTIMESYKNATNWSDYEEYIKDQVDSPYINFVINKDDDGDDIDLLSDIEVIDENDLEKSRVLYEEPALTEYQKYGYVFVCWTYEITTNNWTPVEYPFIIPQITELRAKWVRIDEGSFSDSDINGFDITSYTGEDRDTKVVIPSKYKDEPIVTIGQNVFNGNTSITEIIFLEQSNIKHIKSYAFAGMTSLTEIILPSSLEEIGDYAFAGCTNLTSIYIPKSVEFIGAYAFQNCPNLDIIFEDDSELEDAYINSFEGTQWYAEQISNDEANFVIAGRLIIEYLKNQNQNLVTLPTEAVAIRKELFMGDEDLITVEFHEFIEYIGASAFENCTSLINIDFGKDEDGQDLETQSNINFVGENAFANTAWSIARDKFEEIGGVLIKYKGSDTEITIGEDITAIEKDAFSHKAITSISFHSDSKLKTIAEGAFYNCNQLTSIEIPENVTYIGKDAFKNCINLTSVTFKGEDKVEYIGESAFEGCADLMNVMTDGERKLPSSLATLGKSAFEGCSVLTEINLDGTKIKTIERRTFFGNSNLYKLTLPGIVENNNNIVFAGVESIESEAFSGCINLLTLTTTSQNLNTISEDALTDTAWYKRYEDDSTILIYIGNVLLKGSSASSDVVDIPQGIKYIAKEAFEDSKIKSVDFPEGLIEIGESAFAGCKSITELNIPDSVEKIGQNAFADCSSLETVSLGEGLKEIEAFAFNSCYELIEVTVNRRSYGEISEEQLTDIRGAIDDLENPNALTEWLQENSNVFIGTQLNANAFNNIPTNTLRIYVERDSYDINKELYLSKWGYNIFNKGDLPTVSFENEFGANPLSPISTKLLTETDAYTFYKDHTLLGWEDSEGVPITFPFKVKENITLIPIWLSNDRPSDDLESLGFTYASNDEQTGYTIASYSPTENMIVADDAMVIASTVRGYGLLGINSGVFDESNTAHVKTIMITNNNRLELFDSNPFSMFVNLEKIIINGSDFASLEDYNNYTGVINSRYVTIDGVMYTKDLKTIVSYPRAKDDITRTKTDGTEVICYQIPHGVETVLDYAFRRSSLEELEIPDSMLYIGEGAFDCSYILNEGTEEEEEIVVGFKEIKFGTGSELREVAFGAFDKTEWYLNMQTNFKMAGSYLLSYNGFAEEVIIPDDVKSIGIKAFKNNSLNNIVKLTVPASVIRINENAFEECSNIVDIIFNVESELMYIANDVFMDTSWISSMDIEVNEIVVAGNVLVDYNGGIDMLDYLPSEIKVIGYNAFNNASFSQIVLHENIERIDENAFFGANYLSEITIPASVTSIGNNAFFNCHQLGTVIFAENSNLTHIGNSAFSYCTNLTSIIIPNTVKTIGASAFEYCNTMTSASIGVNSQLEDLGESAFKNAYQLKSIYIPNGLREIKTSTFEGCRALEGFTFSNANRRLTKIGENAFRNCELLGSNLEGRSNLLTVELPYNVNTIENGAFSGCSSLYGIMMQGQIKFIGTNAFYGCSKLANVTISTSQPPSIEATSFNFSAHQELRVYVNISPNETVREAYVIEWGGDKVANSDYILERGDESLPKVMFYDYTAGGVEDHLSSYDMRAELLSLTALNSKNISHVTKGMAVGFYTNNDLQSSSQICTATYPYKVVYDDVVYDSELEEYIFKVYVKWENS